MAAMTSDRGREIGQNIQGLQITGFGDVNKRAVASSFGAAVAKADFAPPTPVRSARSALWSVAPPPS
jgi:hypothetical protein